jgi:hypothetical protein
VSCPDPNCVICTVMRAFHPEAPRSDAERYAKCVADIEQTLRTDESSIVIKEAALEAWKPSDAELAPLHAIIRSMGSDELAFRRARVAKYRALLAEEIGRRVVATAPKAEVSK